MVRGVRSEVKGQCRDAYAVAGVGEPTAENAAGDDPAPHETSRATVARISIPPVNLRPHLRQHRRRQPLGDIQLRPRPELDHAEPLAPPNRLAHPRRADDPPRDQPDDLLHRAHHVLRPRLQQHDRVRLVVRRRLRVRQRVDEFPLLVHDLLDHPVARRPVHVHVEHVEKDPDPHRRPAPHQVARLHVPHVRHQPVRRRHHRLAVVGNRPLRIPEEREQPDDHRDHDQPQRPPDERPVRPRWPPGPPSRSPFPRFHGG